MYLHTAYTHVVRLQYPSLVHQFIYTPDGVNPVWSSSFIGLTLHYFQSQSIMHRTGIRRVRVLPPFDGIKYAYLSHIFVAVSRT